MKTFTTTVIFFLLASAVVVASGVPKRYWDVDVLDYVPSFKKEKTSFLTPIPSGAYTLVMVESNSYDPPKHVTFDSAAECADAIHGFIQTERRLSLSDGRKDIRRIAGFKQTYNMSWYPSIPAAEIDITRVYKGGGTISYTKEFTCLPFREAMN